MAGHPLGPLMAKQSEAAPQAGRMTGVGLCRFRSERSAKKCVRWCWLNDGVDGVDTGADM